MNDLNPAMNQTGIAAPTRTPAIPRQLAAITDILLNCERTVGELIDRLEPVLSEPLPSPEKDSTSESPQSALHGELMSIAQRVQALGRRAGNLLERLTI